MHSLLHYKNSSSCTWFATRNTNIIIFYYFRSGEYHFRLIDAHETRQSLVKLYEIVDGTR